MTLRTRISDPEWEKHSYEDETYWRNDYPDSEDPIAEYNEQWDYAHPVLHPKYGPKIYFWLDKALFMGYAPSIAEQLSKESVLMRMLRKEDDTVGEL